MNLLLSKSGEGRRGAFFDEANYREYLRSMVSSRRRIVYAIEFSSTASHLVAGNSAGQINCFDIHCSSRDPHFFASSPNRKDTQQQKVRACSDHVSTHFLDGTVYALYTDSRSNVLFCGTDGGIVGYKWEDLLDAGDHVETSKPIFSYPVQLKPAVALASSRDGRIEVNAIAGSQGSRIFAGTGIGTVECFTSDTLSYLKRFHGGGADGYAHCVAMLGDVGDTCFVTGGDDGRLRLYDERAGGMPQRVFDLLRMNSARQRAWVGCVASDSDGQFIVTGDANRNLTSIHVGTGAVLDSTELDFVPNSLVYRAGEIYCGGSDIVESSKPSESSSSEEASLLRRYSLSCEEISSASVSAGGVYALAQHPASGCMAAGGYSTRHQWHDTAELIDVYLNPPIRSFTMAAAAGR